MKNFCTWWDSYQQPLDHEMLLCDGTTTAMVMLSWTISS